MSRYKGEKFNYSHMSERLIFQVQESDGSYTDDITVWAHILKDGFTRTETENFYKIMIREQPALEDLLQIGNRIIWKNKKRLMSIFSWQDPSYEDRGFIEILAKQIISDISDYAKEDVSDLFKDFVNVYRVKRTEVNRFGVISYEYNYDFNSPDLTGVRCNFATDRNKYVYDKKTDTEHDSTIVHFSKSSGIKEEDYIISKVQGRFKIDMVTETSDNMLEALVSRSEVQ